ncbi:amidohydrolase family protein [Sandaracinus amylolyticus]|uniref:Putative 2-pyrone-4,6-dicarboxylic acid hydrolase n=1 Tax=Sandaracinus amylolyticus TaxID=927083 RepID=A0A0F6W8V9_9BACT|nr:amidohydrolase family protein [Sandaracinus amylolyticus]AKF10380.1 putative 2-pyrone-4,6-dicarboxylic acid hydrolase [Sandaracinus amylolyticus]
MPADPTPPGACDAHAHVIGASMSAARSYTPPEATVESYLAMLDAHRIARGVLVQISVHGTDNRVMTDAVSAHSDRLRGIAVVHADAPDAELARLASSGVVGLRLNTAFGGGPSLDDLERLAARCRELDWHLELLLDHRALPELAPRLERLPVPFVLDHLGHVPVSAGIAHPAAQAMLSLLRGAHCWVKLSGAYRVSATGPPHRDTIPIVRALVDARADRLVWGSDWPHTAHAGPTPRVGALLDLLREQVPDAAQRDAILVDNAARLYRFGEGG